MKHYEIVLLIHPDQHEQVATMIGRYRTLVESDGGKIYRLEEWGMRKLAYPIERTYKAYYVLMNVECSQGMLAELDEAFRFSDAVIRNMILCRDKAITDPSPLFNSGDAREHASSGADAGDAQGNQSSSGESQVQDGDKE